MDRGHEASAHQEKGGEVRAGGDIHQGPGAARTGVCGVQSKGD
jgi:hypothetical protein